MLRWLSALLRRNREASHSHISRRSEAVSGRSLPSTATRLYLFFVSRWFTILALWRFSRPIARTVSSSAIASVGRFDAADIYRQRLRHTMSITRHLAFILLAHQANGSLWA